MSSPLWALRRLRAMSAGEIAHRARVALRDRALPPTWSHLSPRGAYRALFPASHALFHAAETRVPRLRHAADLARAARWVHGAEELPAAEAAAVRENAAAIQRGEWSLFGHPVHLAVPPEPMRWNVNLLTGAAWPETPSRTIDYRDAADTGGAKFTCEPGRLTFLPDLAQAGMLGDSAASERALALLTDFIEHNPLQHGIHHTSGIEMAIRVATMTATLGMAAQTAPERLNLVLEPALGLLAQQAYWCRDHLSVGSSANNHLLAELMAMTIVGGVWSSVRRADSLLSRGHEKLESEILRQFHPDGVLAEQAFGYLPFIWELVLLGLRAAEVAGHEPSSAVRERLAASLEFARAIRGPGGRVPQVGDEDDACILFAGLPGSRLDLVGNALAAWLGVEPLSDDASTYARALRLEPAPARQATDGRHEFPTGGWTVWRVQGLRVTFDHGPLGLGALAAHGHADALAVTISRGADDLVVDPGTLAYHEDEAARRISRGTPAHATVNFGGRSQAQMLGPFIWGRRAVIEPSGEAWRCRWPGGETHVRRVLVTGGAVTIEDRVRGRRPEVVFPLAPGATARVAGAEAVVECGGSRASFVSEGLEPWRLEPSLHAPRFSHRAAALRLVAGVRGAAARTVIRIDERA